MRERVLETMMLVATVNFGVRLFLYYEAALCAVSTLVGRLPFPRGKTTVKITIAFHTYRPTPQPTLLLLEKAGGLV